MSPSRIVPYAGRMSYHRTNPRLVFLLLLIVSGFATFAQESIDPAQRGVLSRMSELGLPIDSYEIAEATDFAGRADDRLFAADYVGSPDRTAPDNAFIATVQESWRSIRNAAELMELIGYPERAVFLSIGDDHREVFVTFMYGAGNVFLGLNSEISEFRFEPHHRAFEYEGVSVGDTMLEVFQTFGSPVGVASADSEDFELVNQVLNIDGLGREWIWYSDPGVRFFSDTGNPARVAAMYLRRETEL